MRIREENCNMVLLAVVTLVTSVIAGGASLVGPTENKTAYFENWTITRGPSADKQIINISDQPPVRVIGAPFVPNTNPRER
jgi:hypothetical protein